MELNFKGTQEEFNKLYTLYKYKRCIVCPSYNIEESYCEALTPAACTEVFKEMFTSIEIVRWRAEKGGEYFTIIFGNDLVPTLTNAREQGDVINQYHYDMRNYFKSREEATKAALMLNTAVKETFYKAEREGEL